MAGRRLLWEQKHWSSCWKHWMHNNGVPLRSGVLVWFTAVPLDRGLTGTRSVQIYHLTGRMCEVYCIALDLRRKVCSESNVNLRQRELNSLGASQSALQLPRPSITTHWDTDDWQRHYWNLWTAAAQISFWHYFLYCYLKYIIINTLLHFPFTFFSCKLIINSS